jgi:hypothetical protein
VVIAGFSVGLYEAHHYKTIVGGVRLTRKVAGGISTFQHSASLVMGCCVMDVHWASCHELSRAFDQLNTLSESDYKPEEFAAIMAFVAVLATAFQDAPGDEA